MTSLNRQYSPRDQASKPYQKEKPVLEKLFIETLQLYSGSAHGSDDHAERPCGIWMIGALYIILADAMGANRSFSPAPISSKKVKPGASTDEDGRFLTFLLRFITQERSEPQMRELLTHLSDTTRCYCSKDKDVEANDYALTHAPHDIGRDMMDGLLEVGYFLPLINRDGPLPPYSRPFPQPFIYLRGRTLSRSTNNQTSTHSYSIRQPDAVDHATAGVGFIVNVFEIVNRILSNRTSLSFSMGRSKYWPYSPWELLLLIEDPAATASATRSSSENLKAGASTLVLAMQTWSHWIPNQAPTLLLTKMIEICGTQLVPAVVDHSYSTVTLPNTARWLMSMAMSTLRSIDQNGPSTSHFASRKVVGIYVAKHCDTIAKYYWMLICRPDVPFEGHDTLAANNCLRMAQLFTMMMYPGREATM